MSAAVLLFVALAAVVVSRVVLAVLRFRRVELAFDGEPSLPVLGNSLAFLGATEHVLFDRLRGLWGGRRQVTRMSLLGHLILIVSDPEDIEKVIRGKETQDKSRLFYQFIEYFSKNGLVTLNGAEWKAHRKALTPAFHSELLDKYQEIFDEEVKGFLARVRPGVAQNVIPNLKTGSARSFFRTALSTDVTGDAEQFLPVLMDALDAFPRTITSRSFQPWFWPDALFGLTGLGRHVHGLLSKMETFLLKEMARVRSQLHRKGHEEDFIKERPTLIEILLQDSDSPLPDRHIMDEVIIFTGAAIETTVASLGWTFKTLSLRPDVQDRILEEVDEVVGQAGAVLPEHLPRLEYTERVIKESLRLTPAVPMLARGNLHAATTFNGKHVPKGSTFLVNMFGAHRDPRHWQEPLKFDPDRWLPERSQGRHHYAYMPFSAGPRNCIGGRYAMAFMKTLLATVLPRYRVDPVDDGLTDPATFPMAFDIATRLPGGVHVVFTPRPSTSTARHSQRRRRRVRTSSKHGGLRLPGHRPGRVRPRPVAPGRPQVPPRRAGVRRRAVAARPRQLPRLPGRHGARPVRPGPRAVGRPKARHQDVTPGAPHPHRQRPGRHRESDPGQGHAGQVASLLPVHRVLLQERAGDAQRRRVEGAPQGADARLPQRAAGQVPGDLRRGSQGLPGAGAARRGPERDTQPEDRLDEVLLPDGADHGHDRRRGAVPARAYGRPGRLPQHHHVAVLPALVLARRPVRPHWPRPPRTRPALQAGRVRLEGDDQRTQPDSQGAPRGGLHQGAAHADRDPGAGLGQPAARPAHHGRAHHLHRRRHRDHRCLPGLDVQDAVAAARRPGPHPGGGRRGGRPGRRRPTRAPPQAGVHGARHQGVAAPHARRAHACPRQPPRRDHVQRQARPQGQHLPRQHARRPPGPPSLGGAPQVRPRPLAARAQPGPPPLRLHAVQRRPPELHRRPVRHGRHEDPAGQRAPQVPRGPRRRRPHRPRHLPHVLWHRVAAAGRRARRVYPQTALGGVTGTETVVSLEDSGERSQLSWPAKMKLPKDFC